MDFEGRDILCENCSAFLDNERQDFLSFSTKIASKTEMYLDVEDFKDTMELVYDSLVLKSPDFENIKDNLKKIFRTNQYISKYIVTRSCLYFIQLFSNKQLNYLPYALNAVNRMVSTLNDEPIQNFNFEKKDSSSPLFSRTSNLSTDSGFSLHQTTINIFKKIKDANEDLEFLNFYKGIPIKNKSKIVSIDNDEVVFKVDLIQILAMKEEGNAYIMKNNAQGTHIKADIVDFYFADYTVKLNNFTRLNVMPASQRKFPRVYPKVATNVTLTNQKQNIINGKLYDISEGGMGVVSFEDNGFTKNDIIEAKFKIEMNNQEYDIIEQLKLINLLNYQGSLRYCMEMLSDNSQHKIINQFINLREEETLNELKQQLSSYS